MQSKPLIKWNLMIQASTRKGLFLESLNIYSSMHKSNAHGDHFTFPFLAKSCAKLASILDGKKVHAHTILMGFQSDPYVQTSLLGMYSKCSLLSDARKLFDEMRSRTLVSWNSMISAYAHGSQVADSIHLFNKMGIAGIVPDSSTLVSLVSGCSCSSTALHHGLSIQCYGIKVGFDSDLQFSNSVMGMYARSGRVDAAGSLFNSMEGRSIVSWTVIMSGYLRIGDCYKVFDLFNSMRRDQVEPDTVAFMSLISSCALLGNLQVACSAHALLVKCVADYGSTIAASLVNLYAKCSDLLSSQKIFDSVQLKDVFLWTSMIGGYVQKGKSVEALGLFQKLLSSTTKPNEVTIVTILSACTEYGSLAVGEKVEEYARENGLASDLRVQTSLIHMYSKCGNIERAKEIFEKIVNKDLPVWSAMINGYACHGRGKKALELFKEMEKQEGIEPDEIVFTNVIFACSHAGLLEEGLECFYSMKRDYNIEPNVEHYSCVADLLGRAGHFDLGLKLILELPVHEQMQALSPLQSASRYHGVQFGEFSSVDLLKMEPQTSGNYVMMANIHASLGNWKEVTRYRRIMDNKGLIKGTGLSKVDC